MGVVQLLESVTAKPGRASVIALIAALLAAYVLGIAFTDRNITRGQIVAGDGLFYYEYLPSLILDFDLDFANQRAAVRELGVPYSWEYPLLQPTRTGLLGTPFPVGWALLDLAVLRCGARGFARAFRLRFSRATGWLRLR